MNNHFPLYVAGVASGVAMIVAMIFLKESNPLVIQRRNAKKNSVAVAPTESVAAPTESAAAPATESVVEVKEEKKEEAPVEKKKLKVTKTMCLCFCFEFCLRWTVNAFDSRYGIYLTDVFDTPSIVFSSPPSFLSHS